MSEFEYNNLLFQISQRLDNINAAKQLLVICRGKLAARNEESIPTLSLFEELEEGGFLSFDRLTVLKAILEGVEEWALLEKVEKFACKRKEYNNLLEQIIRVLDELIMISNDSFPFAEETLQNEDERASTMLGHCSRS